MLNDLMPVEYSNERILTTEQLADFYETETRRISDNFNANKERFIEGKHYFKLEGDNLKAFREILQYGNSGLQISPMTRTFYLWTKRGAARHAKMLTTEKAWQIFEMLEDTYFDAPKIMVTVSKVKPAEIIGDIGTTRDAIKNVFGVKDGIALAQATSMVEKFYGDDLSELKKLIPPAEHEVGFFTPTQIGKKLVPALKAHKVNDLLIHYGLQLKDGKHRYKLTEKGKKFAELIPFTNTNNGHGGYQILWNDSAVKFLQEMLDCSLL